MKEKIVSARTNALWFTYIALFLFSLLPNWDVYLNLVEIMGISAGFTALLNLWYMYLDTELFDERKKEVVTNGMAWAFVVLSIALITTVSVESDLTKEMIRETASLGLWTWLTYFSVSNLYHKYGDDLL
jgi:DMSO/TMAO reductase YedYZ heme-binding membrane subunit